MTDTPNLPAKSTSKGIQKAHVRRIPTRQGPKPVIINPSVQKGVPVVSKSIEKPIASAPTTPAPIEKRVMLPPKERTDLVAEKEALEKIAKAKYNSYLSSVPVMLLGMAQIPAMGWAEMPMCPICQEKVGVIMTTNNPLNKWPGVPISLAVCEKCFTEGLSKGIMILSMDENEHWDQRLVVVSEPGFKEMFKVPIDKVIKQGRFIFMKSQDFSKMFGNKEAGNG